MTKRILIIQGHPDNQIAHLCHTLAAAYADGARTAGHEVRQLEVAALELPLLRSKQDFERAPDDPRLQAVQADVQWAQHLVFLFPLWLGEMPAMLKGFLEQVCRPMAGAPGDFGSLMQRMQGKSARIVITMGMPALVYRWYFLAHGLKNLQRNILGFVGVKPVRNTLIGMVEKMTPQRLTSLQQKMHSLGTAAK